MENTILRINLPYTEIFVIFYQDLVVRCTLPQPCADLGSSKFFDWFGLTVKVEPGSCWDPLFMHTDRK